MRVRSRWVFGGIIFLVATFAFAVGYIVCGEERHAPIIIEACGTVVPALGFATSSSP